jgi:hypothetical protein
MPRVKLGNVIINAVLKLVCFGAKYDTPYQFGLSTERLNVEINFPSTYDVSFTKCVAIVQSRNKKSREANFEVYYLGLLSNLGQDPKMVFLYIQFLEA